MKYRQSNHNAPGMCGCITLIAIINLTIGSLAFSYCLNTLWGTHLPWYLNMIGGLFLGEITIPLTVILWLVTLSGAHVPLIH